MLLHPENKKNYVTLVPFNKKQFLKGEKKERERERER
jgi:hypothetical protein